MTTKEKIKASIEENAKYKVGQTVYWRYGEELVRSTVVSIGINDGRDDFTYYGGRWGRYLGVESSVYGSFAEACDARRAELTAELNELAAAKEDDVRWIDKDDDE